jgi:hypothetical protein
MTMFFGRRWLATTNLVKAAGYTAMRPIGFTWRRCFIGVMVFKRHDWSQGRPNASSLRGAEKESR